MTNTGIPKPERDPEDEEEEEDQDCVSLYEHCRQESGLHGPALDRYIQRYYGHG